MTDTTEARISELEQRVVDLEAALKVFAAMWGSHTAHSDSKKAQAKRAEMWRLYRVAMGGAV